MWVGMKISTIKDFYGKKLGTIEEEPNGNQICRNFYGKVVARYDKQSNKTTDFYGRVVAFGNVVVSYIFTPPKQ